MKAFLFLFFLILSGTASALPHYYLFEHDLRIEERRFSAVIILPAYYSRNFGLLEELDYELREQELNPIPDEKIFQAVDALQTILWKEYDRSPFLAGKSLKDDEFASFRAIERFWDGRSAIFAVVEKQAEGKIGDGVAFTLEAMVRMSSIVDITAPDQLGRLLQRTLPCHLRASLTEDGTAQRARYPELFEARFQNRRVGYVPIFLEREGVLGRAEGECAWWEGAPLELKAWYHQPKVIRTMVDGKSHSEVIDFLPDLLEIALMYGGFDRTGVSLASLAHDEQSQKDMDGVLRILNHLTGKQPTARDLGVRSGEFWTEVIELPLANREQKEFDMDLRLQFGDPHFKGFQNNVLWTTRERLLPALGRWAGKRAGAKLLPLSRLVVERRSQISCVQSLLHPGVGLLAHPDEQVQAIGIYVK